MCGFYGSTKIYDPSVIEAKLKRIQFRGPDASHYRNYDNRVILGQNRLSIIDLDARSHQPFEYEHVSIVFNGEMYNFQDVRKDLVAKGFAFRTTSDTEVICAAYLAYGEACVAQFNGMFAFVLYDHKAHKLFGARDRLGKKPFYYTLKDQSFECASQPSQIAISNNLTTNEKAINQYLIWTHIPDPLSIYNEVQKLRAGYSFTYDLATHRFDTKPYWSLNSSEFNTFKGSYDDAKAELRTLLSDAVRMRMISDVPLGAFLSGGVDSSLVCALAQDLLPKGQPLRTFTIKFTEKKYDESPYAEAVAKILGTNHLSILCDYKEGMNMIENFTDYYDEPFADSSAIPSMLLAKHTKQYVTVALTGDAGDESFLGYKRYEYAVKIAPLFKIPRTLRRLAAIPLSILPLSKAKTAANLMSEPDLRDVYYRHMSVFDTSWLQDFQKGVSNEYIEYLNANKPIIEAVSDFDIKTYLNNDLNTKVDRATMSASLEARAPIMDYRIVELGRRLPTHFKYQNGNKKRILKDLLRDYLPDDLIERPKQGFGVPIGQWFQQELKEMVMDSLTKDFLSSLPNIHVPVVLKKIEDHVNGVNSSFGTQIFSLLILEQWQRRNKTQNQIGGLIQTF
ncbi:MAG: asparagine synthase (glutamine-hydrolyzing) [Saprospiraceae bacterium]|nr:asparagine synthase (glutamine-hydrolyzing) [Saprospiraceae bacterium]